MFLTDQQAISIIRVDDHMHCEGIGHSFDKNWEAVVRAAEKQTGQLSDWHIERLKKRNQQK